MKPTVFRDLPADRYPFTIIAYPMADPERIVWQETVEGPGSLYVPGLAAKHGPVGIRVEYANGLVEVEEP